MCFKTEKAPLVDNSPKRQDLRYLAQEERKKLSTQPGIFGNLTRGALGDTDYGKNAVAPKLAKLGGNGTAASAYA